MFSTIWDKMVLKGEVLRQFFSHQIKVFSLSEPTKFLATIVSLAYPRRIVCAVSVMWESWMRVISSDFDKIQQPDLFNAFSFRFFNHAEAAKAFELLRVHHLENRHPGHWLPQPGRLCSPLHRLNCDNGGTNGKCGYLLIKCLAGYFQALVDEVVKFMDKNDLRAHDPIGYWAVTKEISSG